MDRSTVSIRDADIREAGRVLDLWRVTFASENTHGDLADVQRVIDGERGARMLVVEVDGVLAGTVIATFDGWRGHMYRIAVLPEQRRRGLAGALVDAAESWLRSVGCQRVRLTVERDNSLGVDFWQARGYAPDSDSYFRNL